MLFTIFTKSRQFFLEDSSTPTTIGISFLLLGRVSKSFPILVLSTFNTKFLLWPNMSKCAIYKRLFGRLTPLLSNIALIWYPLMHASQIDENVEQWILPSLQCMNILYIEMPKLVMSKLNCNIFFQWCCASDHIYSIHFHNAQF